MDASSIVRRLQSGHIRDMEYELHDPWQWWWLFRNADHNVRKQLRRLIWRQTWLVCHLPHAVLSYGQCVEATVVVPPAVESVQEPDGVRFVTVLNDDMLVVAQRLVYSHKRTVVLNMASSRHPGGNVGRGAGAQEENLHRRTNLHRFLYEQKAGTYPIGDRVLLSQNVLVFRGPEYEGYPFLRWPFHIDVVSAAAVQQRWAWAAWAETTMVNRLRTLLEAIKQSDCDAAVLSAWGCGAYGNDPYKIAQLFHAALNASHGMRNVEFYFCILDDHNTFSEHNPRGNLTPFVEEFSSFTTVGVP